MRLLHFFVLLLMSASLCTAQESQKITPERVFGFSNGNSDQELGLNIRAAQRDADTDYYPRAIYADWNSIWILDNVNGRLLQYKKDMSFVESYKFSSTGLSRVWKTGPYIVVGNNLLGPDRLYALTIVDTRTKENNVVTIDSIKTPNNKESFYFVSNIDNVLFFQSRNEFYFGIQISSDKKFAIEDVLNEQQVQKILQKNHHLVLDTKSHTFINKSMLLSGSIETVQRYYGEKKDFDESAYGFLGNAEYLSLANNIGFFFGLREILFFDSNGRNVGKYMLPSEKESLRTSNFSPSPDGYIYYLSSDLEKAQTNLYRIGPFPEVLLGFQSITAKISDSRVNLRDNSSVKGTILQQLDMGTPVRILEKTEKPETISGQTSVWYRVRLWDRIEGWVFGAFVDIQK